MNITSDSQFEDQYKDPELDFNQTLTHFHSNFNNTAENLDKVYISRKHTQISQGLESPGPIYNTSKDIGGKESISRSFGRCERSKLVSPNIFIGEKFTSERLCADSPGPKYSAYETGKGTSVAFSKDAKDLGSKIAPTPGPKYHANKSIGKQTETKKRNEPNFSFPKNSRFTENEYVSSEFMISTNLASRAPGPGTHNTKDFKETSFSFTQARRAVTPGKSSEKKKFISKLHSMAETGGDSPGPKYEYAKSIDKTVKKSYKSYSFGLSHRPRDRVPSKDEIRRRRKANRPFTTHSTKFISSLHSKAISGIDSPGPAIYKPVNPKKHSKAASFGISNEKEKKKFFSDTLSSTRGLLAPGSPTYSPNTAFNSKRSATPIFYQHNRKVLEVNRDETPAPDKYMTYPTRIGLYAPAVPFQGRETDLPPSISPQPTRIRFHSKELAKENEGVFSPGPQYYTRGVIGHFGPKVSFGVSDRHHNGEKKSNENFKSPGHARYFGSGTVKFIDRGRDSPGPQIYKKDKALNKTLKSQPAFSFPKGNPEISKKFRKKQKKAGKLFAPNSIRCISRQHSKAENQGVYSPGPKYNPKVQPSNMKKYSTWKFGTEKRSFEIGDPKTPGPVYTPHYNFVMKKSKSAVIGGLS